VLADLPERALGVEHHIFAVQAEDAAPAPGVMVKA
jgi:hypothetical protein